MKKALWFIPFFMTGLSDYCHGQTQQANIVAGGYRKDTESSIERTLGEPIMAPAKNDGSTLTQDFHQASLTVTAIKTIDSLPYAIEAYSNPTGDLLLIQLKNVNSRDFWYVLYDMTGKVIAQQAFESDVTAVKMVNYPAGVYLLIVMRPEKEVKTFEVIKQ